MILKSVLDHISSVLKEAGIQDHRREARLLASLALDMTPEKVFLEENLEISSDQEKKIEEILKQRAARKPFSKITKTKEFWSMDFFVDENVLDPRPDSESLIEAALDQINDKKQPLKILEMGVGSGCLIITLLTELIGASGIATDISLKACTVAEKNAKMRQVSERLEICQMSWGESLEGKFDIIISNPPYIRLDCKDTLQPEVHYDPALALYGGEDGFDCYRDLAPDLQRLLSKDGFAVLEIGEGQEEEIEKILERNNLKVIGIKKDLSLKNRCLIIRLKESVSYEC